MNMAPMNNVAIFLIIVTVNATVTRILLKSLSGWLMDKGVYGYDVNKPDKTRVPEESGVSIAIALVFTLTLYGYFLSIRWIGLLVATTILISLIGFVDRLRNIRPIPKFAYCAVVGSVYSISFLQDPAMPVHHAILFLLAASLVYAVLVNSFNMLAGFNGLEAGLTVISSMTLALFFGLKHQYEAAGVALLLMTGFLVFWPLNRYPARLFLGDSGSLLPASIFFGLALITRQWIPILFIMAPHLVNTTIKFFSTGISSKTDYDPLVYRDGRLHLPARNYWSLIRLYLRTGPKSETSIVYFVYGLEVICCSLLFIFYA